METIDLRVFDTVEERGREAVACANGCADHYSVILITGRRVVPNLREEVRVYHPDDLLRGMGGSNMCFVLDGQHDAVFRDIIAPLLVMERPPPIALFGTRDEWTNVQTVFSDDMYYRPVRQVRTIGIEMIRRAYE